ncbi:aspartic peptidase domain-containing protein [Exophiala viscosa]|uniref:aspartic peptidase domain-containing protein n=1 Tax=Exophiala viscosa TaxID=2486360 RepID=UPI0021A09B37|nr:aspartic peptidase domain-containing protein [Exophiala viscosa]
MSVCQNGAAPMYLPWTNVTVTTDQEAITRGIQMSMGTPPQIVALRPSTSDDNLYVVNKVQCAPDYNDTCVGSFGGVFDYNTSSTFVQVAQAQWNGTAEANPNELSLVHFNDLLTVGNASIYGYPAIYDEPGYGGQGVLPLGSSSDLLTIAVENGDVPSTVFGLWTGSRSIETPKDGGLVLGGYDTSRINGELTTFPSQTLCEMCVNVTGITYADATGSHNMFSNSSEIVQINLQPSERVLYLPQDVWANFGTASGGVYNDSLGYLAYSASNPPTGNLTVTLSGGYNTTIPAEELFLMPRHYNDEGQYVIEDDTTLIAAVYNQSANGYVLNWGIPFLTMNYIIGDYKRQQFKMAPAIRRDFSATESAYKLQASCDPTTNSTPTTSASGTASASAVGGRTTSSSPAASSSSGGGHSNTGAIVGGVVGGVLGLVAIVGGLALMFYRSRRKRNAAAATTAPPAAGQQGMSQYGSAGDRHSQWTTMSPTEVPSELANNQKTGGDVNVNNWLSSQTSDTHTVSDSTSPNPTHTSNMDRPFEMPAQTWDR